MDDGEPPNRFLDDEFLEGRKPPNKYLEPLYAFVFLCSFALLLLYPLTTFIFLILSYCTYVGYTTDKKAQRRRLLKKRKSKNTYYIDNRLL